MSKPSIILVPGAATLPEFYDNVTLPVAAAGYEIKTLHLGSAGLRGGEGRDSPPGTMYEDAALIANEVSALADQGKDVVIFAHSYGGIPSSQSTKGLSKKERQEQGKPGGVVQLAYLTALVPALGATGMEISGSFRDERNQATFLPDENGWLFLEDLSKAAQVVFSGLPQEEGEAWIRRFPGQSAVSLMEPLTHVGYKDVPVSYLLCEEDIMISPANQRNGIEVIERASGRSVDVTSIKSDHCPMVSHPQAMVDWMLNVAEKSQE